jgi:hypothetical protein
MAAMGYISSRYQKFRTPISQAACSSYPTHKRSCEGRTHFEKWAFVLLNGANGILLDEMAAETQCSS